MNLTRRTVLKRGGLAVVAASSLVESMLGDAPAPPKP